MLEVEPRRSVEPNARSERPLPRNTLPWVDALALAEGGLLADVAVLLELVRVFLPVVGIAFAPLVPTPFALLVLRRGSRPTLLAVAVGVLLVSLIAGPHYGWRMGVSGLVGLALGFAMKARLRPAVIVAVGTLLTSLALYGFFFASIWLLALPLKDVVAEMQNLLHTANSAAAFLAAHLGLDTVWQHLAPSVLAVEDWMIAYWPLVLYGVILGVSLGTVVLYYAVANRFVRLLGFAVRPFPSPRFAQGIQKVGRLAQRVWLRPKRQQTAVGAAASVGELKPVDQHEPVDSRC